MEYFFVVFRVDKKDYRGYKLPFCLQKTCDYLKNNATKLLLQKRRKKQKTPFLTGEKIYSFLLKSYSIHMHNNLACLKF